MYLNPFCYTYVITTDWEPAEGGPVTGNHGSTNNGEGEV